MFKIIWLTLQHCVAIKNNTNNNIALVKSDTDSVQFYKTIARKNELACIKIHEN